jgi:hypothetical protein
VAGVGAAHRVGPQRFLDRQALVRRVGLVRQSDSGHSPKERHLRGVPGRGW